MTLAMLTPLDHLLCKPRPAFVVKSEFAEAITTVTTVTTSPMQVTTGHGKLMVKIWKRCNALLGSSKKLSIEFNNRLIVGTQTQSFSKVRFATVSITQGGLCFGAQC